MTAAKPVDLTALRTPFPREQIGRLPKGGAWLDYVGHADVTDRLLNVDPAWSWEPLALDARGLPAFDDAGGLWIRLTVGGVTRLGYGDAGGKKGPNAVKEAIGDALRNAAMRFGVALDLWAKGDRDFGVGHDTGGPTHAPETDETWLAQWRDKLHKAKDEDTLVELWRSLGAMATSHRLTEADADTCKQQWRNVAARVRGDAAEPQAGAA